MEECRVRFLQTFEAQMNEAVEREHAEFRGTFYAGEVIGIGLAGEEEAAHDICLATFWCVYEDGRWWEITAFPNLRVESKLTLEERMNYQPTGRSNP
jgi:hypothetical protein